MRTLTRLSVVAGGVLAAGFMALVPSLALADGPPGPHGSFVDPLQSTIPSTVPAEAKRAGCSLSHWDDR